MIIHLENLFLGLLLSDRLRQVFTVSKHNTCPYKIFMTKVVEIPIASRVDLDQTALF